MTLLPLTIRITRRSRFGAFLGLLYIARLPLGARTQSPIRGGSTGKSHRCLRRCRRAQTNRQNPAHRLAHAVRYDEVLWRPGHGNDSAETAVTIALVRF